MIKTWLNNELWEGDLSISPNDRGLTLGDGVFETLAVTDGVVLWRREHLDRMSKACAELGLPFPQRQTGEAIDALTRHAKGLQVLRLTLTRGVGARGLAGTITKPTLIGTLQPFDVAMRFQPVTLMTTGIRRNLQSPSSRIKTLSYIDNILAAREAAAAGMDDAVMLNTAGRVACSTVGNVFLEVAGALVTPSLKEGILPGIMRDVVIAEAKKMGVTVRERQVRAPDIAKADAMFVTNSLRFLRSVTRCDKKRFTRPSKLLDSLCKGLLNAEQEQLILQRG
jgi:branched-chain amino acid aminotransferase